MHDLEALMRERIASGLRRRSIDSCSKWARAYRVMSKPFPGPFSFKYHPWLREMHDSKAEMNIGQKCAQVGFTEWALNTVFYKIDIQATDCLYILPSNDDASDFSSGRFGPALELSPHLRGLFSNVDNVGHKRAGQQNLYVRGSKSRSKLKSIPTGFVVFDEVDEMNQENIELAFERASGQAEKQFLMISTPTTDNRGINARFRSSTQEHFHFKCPSCGRLTELIYPDCLVITANSLEDPGIRNSYYICKECKNRLPSKFGAFGEGSIDYAKVDYLQTGRFVPQYSDREWRGFTVNQMYSCVIHPYQIAESVFKADRDPAAATELYNSKLGLTFEAPGAKVADENLDNCVEDFNKGTSNDGHVVTMGIDVGKLIHFEIDLWALPQHYPPGELVNEYAIPKLILEGTVKEFSELDALMNTFYVAFCVIDKQPETRSALSFAQRFWGRVHLCTYNASINGRQLQKQVEDELAITVNRTSWLDQSLGRFKSKLIRLPRDISKEYREHIKAPTRVYSSDKDGNPIAKYVNSAPDHFAHARNYAEIALPLALSKGKTSNIRNVL